ncbi:Bgt-4529 [Blumeria graminis f. sp. tritici]|uniref:Bgt-4529 n=1 Tax=Blumeria graminis f. sp. tritici TaxID=62690 RepID=A0A9X9PRX9_BLUGR|nr:Bgt-4529 [Blumeria graminis f. sp. tritici]
MRLAPIASIVLGSSYLVHSQWTVQRFMKAKASHSLETREESPAWEDDKLVPDAAGNKMDAQGEFDASVAESAKKVTVMSINAGVKLETGMLDSDNSLEHLKQILKDKSPGKKIIHIDADSLGNDNALEKLKDSLKDKSPENILDAVIDLMDGKNKVIPETQSSTASQTYISTSTLSNPTMATGNTKPSITANITGTTKLPSVSELPRPPALDAGQPSSNSTNSFLNSTINGEIKGGKTPAILAPGNVTGNITAPSPSITPSENSTEACTCSCLCGPGLMSSLPMTETGMSIPGSPDTTVSGKGKLLPDGACACSCFCDADSFSGSEMQDPSLAPSSKSDGLSKPPAIPDGKLDPENMQKPPAILTPVIPGVRPDLTSEGPENLSGAPSAMPDGQSSPGNSLQPTSGNSDNLSEAPSIVPERNSTSGNPENLQGAPSAVPDGQTNSGDSLQPTPGNSDNLSEAPSTVPERNSTSGNPENLQGAPSAVPDGQTNSGDSLQPTPGNSDNLSESPSTVPERNSTSGNPENLQGAPSAVPDGQTNSGDSLQPTPGNSDNLSEAPSTVPERNSTSGNPENLPGGSSDKPTVPQVTPKLPTENPTKPSEGLESLPVSGLKPTPDTLPKESPKSPESEVLLPVPKVTTSNEDTKSSALFLPVPKLSKGSQGTDSNKALPSSESGLSEVKLPLVSTKGGKSSGVGEALKDENSRNALLSGSTSSVVLGVSLTRRGTDKIPRIARYFRIRK